MTTSKTTVPVPEHPFAPFVRILGKGKSGSRSLSQAEAAQAMGMDFGELCWRILETSFNQQSASATQGVAENVA